MERLEVCKQGLEDRLIAIPTNHQKRWASLVDENTGMSQLETTRTSNQDETDLEAVQDIGRVSAFLV